MQNTFIGKDVLPCLKKNYLAQQSLMASGEYGSMKTCTDWIKILTGNVHGY